MERKKHISAKVYYSKEYITFVCPVESVYLSSLSLEGRSAYSDSDIVDKIKTSLLPGNLAVG